jgi:FkbM family methyltransferase
MKNVSTLHSLYLLFQIDRIRQLLSFLSRNIRTTKNWPDLLLLRFGKKKTVKAVFRDGTTLDISKDSYSIFRNLQESRIRKLSMRGDAYLIPFRQKEILLTGKEVPILAAEIFFNGTYAPTHPEGRIVVDVGANIGDSAIYFALQGAKKVVAFEPYAGVFNTALENIRLNNISSVEMVRSAVGPKSGTMTIDPDIESNSGSVAQNHAHGEDVPVKSLEDVVKEYGVSDSVLKMDCEGCEYDILLSAKNETLACFSEIIVEYHYGYLDLRKKLESAGFSVSLIGFPYRVHNKNVPNPNMVVGFIFARK